MSLFSSFGIKNFRVFDETKGFFEDLASINLLTGTNSSGKSSLIKALQMLNNSVLKNNSLFILDFSNQNHPSW